MSVLARAIIRDVMAELIENHGFDGWDDISPAGQVKLRDELAEIVQRLLDAASILTHLDDRQRAEEMRQKRPPRLG